MEPTRQELVFALAGPPSGELASVRLGLTRGGESVEVVLTDDGAHPTDVPWDGVWTGGHVGVPVRDVVASIVVTNAAGGEEPIFSGSVPVHDLRHATVAWQVSGETGHFRAQTIVTALPGGAAVLPEGVSIYLGAAWTAVCFAIVAALVHVTRRNGAGW